MFHERRREKIGYAGKMVICTTWLKSEIGTYKKDTLKAYKQANRMLNRRIHFYFNWEQMSKLNNSLSLKIWNEWQVNNFDDNLFAFKVTGRASVISEKLDGHNVNLEFYLHSGYENKEHIYIIQDLLNFAMACSFLLAQARVGHGPSVDCTPESRWTALRIRGRDRATGG